MYIQFSHRSILKPNLFSSSPNGSWKSLRLQKPAANLHPMRPSCSNSPQQWGRCSNRMMTNGLSPKSSGFLCFFFFWSVDDHLMRFSVFFWICWWPKCFFFLFFSEQKSIINWWECRNAPWCPMFGKAANPTRFVRHGVKARTVVYSCVIQNCHQIIVTLQFFGVRHGSVINICSSASLIRVSAGLHTCSIKAKDVRHFSPRNWSCRVDGRRIHKGRQIRRHLGTPGTRRFLTTPWPNVASHANHACHASLQTSWAMAATWLRSSQSDCKSTRPYQAIPGYTRPYLSYLSEEGSQNVSTVKWYQKSFSNMHMHLLLVAFVQRGRSKTGCDTSNLLPPPWLVVLFGLALAPLGTFSPPAVFAQARITVWALPSYGDSIL